MKVTLIGFWGGYPEKGEATSCYLFEENDYNLLLDLGSGALAQLQNFIDLKKINSVILSHYHHDHVADIGVLQYYKIINKQSDGYTLPIYGHGLDSEKFKTLTSKDVTVGIQYDPNEVLKLGPFTIQFLKTMHPVDCYAMRIEASNHTVVYTADSSYMSEFIEFSQEADLFITDSNMFENQDGSKAGHMSSKEVATIAKEANVKELLLSHLPHSGDVTNLKREATKYFDGIITIAKTGYQWNSN